ncbi:MAG: hypothetical protein M3462_10410 [Chloroflexota bacterium]|nr:hypothetical protein [Chloroflexota bacterium]
MSPSPPAVIAASACSGPAMSARATLMRAAARDDQILARLPGGAWQKRWEQDLAEGERATVREMPWIGR